MELPGLTLDIGVEVMVNAERSHRETLRHGYAWLEALQNGDMVTLNWPLPERAILYDLGDARFTGYWRGDTLLRMDPPGQLSPLYWRPLDPVPAPPHGATGPVREIDSL